jgi:hypothetical protein
VEKCDDPSKALPLLLQMRYNVETVLIPSLGSVLGWWWGLGLFSLVLLVQSPDERVTALLRPICE